MIEFLMVPRGAEADGAVQPRDGSRGLGLRHRGQVPTDPDDDSASLPDGIERQTRRVIDNLLRVLAGIGSGLDQVVFARLYLTHFARDYAAMNAVYQSYFRPGITRHAPSSVSPLWRAPPRRDRSAGKSNASLT